MSRSLRRGAIAALVVLAIAPLSACAAGGDAATRQVAPNNVSATLGRTLRLNQVLVVTPAGAATMNGTVSGPVGVSVNIANNGRSAETLQAVDVAGAGPATLTDAHGHQVSQLTIPAGGSVLLGGPGHPTARVDGAAVRPGGYQTVVFTFRTAGRIPVRAQVVPGTGDWASFGPSTSAPASPSGSASPQVSGSPTAAGSASATAGSTKSSAKSSAKPSASATS